MRACVFAHGPYNKSFKAEIGNREITSHLEQRHESLSHAQKNGLISFQREHAAHSCIKKLKTGQECIRILTVYSQNGCTNYIKPLFGSS